MHIINEEPTMPRTMSFKRGNYSHCPLKKRPVHVIIKEELDHLNDVSDGNNSEPENLSTKPEDLTCKSITPPIGVALISTKKEPEVPERMDDSPVSAHPLIQGGHFMGKPAGPLEPLNLNTQPELPAWPRPYYPPHYLPLNYHYPPQMYHYYGDKYAPPAASPPHQTYVPSLPQPRPIYMPYPTAAAAAPGVECGLSPTSSTSSLSHGVYSHPPGTPEDLSSPGSVGSSSGSCSPTRKRKDASPRYQCPFCSKSYSTYSGLSKHQQFHCQANEDSSSAKKTFSCKDCDKVYVSLGALKMHIRTHTLPCKCKLCGKAFSRPWLLQGHIRTHTGEKPFTCQHCNRAFADRSNLRAHLQTHSDVKKYSCPTCSKTFSRMSLLTKHTEGGCPGSQSPIREDCYQHEAIYSS